MIIGTGETSELTARALADSGARPPVRRHPSPRPRGQPRPPVRRLCVAFDELPEALAKADIVVAATASPHLLLEARELSEVMDAPGQPPPAADRPRRPARHRRRSGGDRRRVAARHRRPRGGDRAQPAGPPRPRRPSRQRGSSRRRSSTSRRGLARSRCCRRSPRCATKSTEIAEQIVRENRGKWESASPRDLERIDAIARASSTDCCTTRRRG